MYHKSSRSRTGFYPVAVPLRRVLYRLPQRRLGQQPVRQRELLVVYGEFRGERVQLELQLRWQLQPSEQQQQVQRICRTLRSRVVLGVALRVIIGSPLAPRVLARRVVGYFSPMHCPLQRFTRPRRIKQNTQASSRINRNVPIPPHLLPQLPRIIMTRKPNIRNDRFHVAIPHPGLDRRFPKTAAKALR